MFSGARRGWIGQGGFTLIEMMVGVAIVGVLVTVAIPNYSVWSMNQRLKESAVELKGDLQIARIMAIKTGASTAILFNQPEPGQYLVFFENGPANGTLDNGESLMGPGGQAVATTTAAAQQANARTLAGGISFDAVQTIQFDSSGRRSSQPGGGPVDLTLQHETTHGTSTTATTRTVQVMPIGEAHVQ